MSLDVCDPRKVWLSVAGLLAYSLLECWIGKTNKTRANSVMELAFLTTISVAVWAWSKLKRKKDPNG